MSERTTLVGVVLALVGIVWAVGAGPAAALGRQAASRIVLAPLIGLALCASLLTTAAAIMPLGVAAYAVLVPAIVFSLAAAVMLLVRRRERPTPSELAIPLFIAAAGVLIALAPGLEVGSAGPYTGALRDAWWYVAMGDWLRDHTVWDTPTDTVWVRDLMGATGWVALQVNARLGLTAIVPTVSELLGVSTDVALYPVMVLQFGLLPLALWVSSRAIGLGRLAGAVAALLGLGALPLSLVFDTALGNIAGLIFTPLVIAYGIRAARTDAWSDIALAAIFGAALVSSYPEYVPAVVVVAVVVGAWLVVRALRHRRPRSLRAPARRLALVAVGVAVLTPFALVRLVGYLLWANGATSSIVDRGLTLKTIGAWATGLMHPYQLGEIATLSPPLQVLLVVGPLLILALAVGGAFARRDAGDVVLVLVPMVVGVVLGLYVFKTGATDGGDCQYCLAKAFSFGVPAMAIGVGAGVQALVLLVRSGRGVTRAVAAGALAALAGAGVVIGFGTAHMSQTIVDTAAYVPPEVRALSDDGPRVGVKGGVFIEGIEATGDLVYFLPALYQTVTKMPGAFPVYDGFWGAGYDLHLLANPISEGRNLPYQDYEDPGYGYVLSAYSGLDTGREVLARHGRYALERRAPVDVTVTRTGKIVGGPDRIATIAARPTVIGTVQLRVASPRADVGHVVVTAENAGPPPRRAFLASADPAVSRINYSRAEAGATTCFTVDLRRGFTQFDVMPASGATPPLTLTSTRAGMGACPAPDRPVVVPPSAVVGGDVFPTEPLFAKGGPAQWIGTRAFVDIVPNGQARPATRVRMRTVSFIRPQTATVRVGGRVVGKVTGSLDFAHPATLDIRLPAGRGSVRLDITTAPGALPASQVNPADPRRIAMALGTPEVVVLAGQG